MPLNFTEVRTLFLPYCNSLLSNKCKRPIEYLLSSLFFLSLLIPSVVKSQSLLTTPTSLYNYQTDVSANKGACVSISESGNVAVKGTPFVNGGIGSVTLYIRGNDGNWSASLLLTPNDITGNANFGSAIAISADASTIVVGANNDNSGIGALWVYKKVGNTNQFNQYGTKILPKDYNGKSAIGTSVAVSGDGSRIVVGGPNDNLAVSLFESAPGTVRLPIINQTIDFGINGMPIWAISKYVDVTNSNIYNLPAIIRWPELWIPPVMDAFRDACGVWATEYNRANVGAAWVFKLNVNGKYQQDGDKLQNKGRDGLFGFGLINSTINLGAGATAVDSANSLFFANQNAALDEINRVLKIMEPMNSICPFVPSIPVTSIPKFVFTRDVSSITPDASSPFYADLLALKNATNSRPWINAYQGSSVSISKDGTAIMMGAPGLLNGKGVSYIYKYSSNVWNGEEVLAVGDTAGGKTAFGSSLTISQDGLNAVIGAPNSLIGADTIGAAWIYQRNNSNRWTKVGNKIVPNDYTVGTNHKVSIGTSVGISSDNDDIVIGAPYDNNGNGAIWLYKPISGTWTKQQNKLSPSGISNSNLGASIAIGEYGLTTISSAPNLSVGGNAYIYNSCQPPKPIITQYNDTLCSGYQYNQYYQNNFRLNSGTKWVWRQGSTSVSPFAPGTNETSDDHYLLKNSFNSNTTFYVRAEGGCVNGFFDSITTIVKPSPKITSVTPNYVCAPGGQITLAATSDMGTVKWVDHAYAREVKYNDYKQPYTEMISATGNIYKPSISSTGNFYATATLNKCWADTVSVNARIENIPTIDNSSESWPTPICDDRLANYSKVLSAPTFQTLQQLQSLIHPEQTTTQLPLTYNWFDVANGGNPLLSSSSEQFITPNIQANSNQSLYKYYYSISNSCGSSSRKLINLVVTGKGSFLANITTNDSLLNCTSTKGVVNLDNQLIGPYYPNNKWTFNIYDSATGNNKLSSLDIKYNYNPATGLTERLKTTFVTPTILNASRNYFVSITNGCGETPRVVVPITVDNNAPPKVFNISAQDVCIAGTSQLYAETNEGTILWYNSPLVGAIPIAQGNYFTTPYLNTSTNYYVTTTTAKCPTSQKILVQAPIWEQPNLIVNTTSYNTCNAGDEAVMTASTDWGVVNWYTTASGGTPFWTGSTARVYPTSTTTYYVEANHFCSSSRVAVTVTVNNNLQITQTVPGSRTNAGTVILGATANIGTPIWTATDGSILGSGNSFTTNSISSNTTYYVAASANGCTSTRVPVIAKINTVPIVNNTMNASRCGAGTVTLSASAEVGTIRWFDASYNQVGTGNSFTTPSLNTTTTYYAQSWYLNANSQYVQSAFIPVKAYIFTLNNPTVNFSGACNGQKANVVVRSSQTSVKYSLRNGNTVVDSSFGTGNDITLVTPTLNSSTTFNVFAEKYDSSTALNFDGNDDYVEVLNHGGFNPATNVLLAAWINRNDVQKNNYIISKGSFSGNNGYSLSILSDYKLTFDIGNKRFQTTTTIPANAWTHVAASYNGNTVNLYINGTISASFSSSGTISVNQGNLIIGSSQDYKGDANYGFAGKIDEVAVFCGVTFNTPIADIMNSKLVGNEYGLIAYYNFEHGAGITNLFDLASNAGANNGILNNMDVNAAWVAGPSIAYCNSQLSSSTLTPVSMPSVVVANAASRVGPGSLTISAVPSSGATIQWFTDTISATPLSTGNSLVIPILNYTTKYYAVANNGCSSTRVPIVATVNDYPDNQQINCINSSADVNFFNYVSAPSTAIIRSGQYLFTGDNNGAINVYSTGSGSLTFVSSLVLSANNQIYHLEVANGYLYATVHGANNIYVIDFADVAALKLMGISNSSYNSPSSFAVDNHYAYISSIDDQKMYIINIGTPYNVMYVNSIALGEGAYCVQKKDNIAYVGVNNAGIKLINVSSPNNPYISKTISFTGSYNNFYIKGNYLYVSPAMSYNTSSYNTVLKVYDITDASNPVFVRDVSLPDGYAVSYTSDTKYLYLTTYSQTTGATKLHILDIATPSNPVLVVSKTNVSNAGIAVRLGHIYTIDAGITDYALTTAPSIISTTPATRYGTGTVQLNATALSGSISWYNVASGGSAIGIGSNFTTPSISTTTTYYVGAADGICSSFRVPVIATVNELPLCISSSADLGSPVKLTTLDAKATTRSGNYLYVTGGSLVYAYNISSGSPVQAGTIDLGGPAAIYELKIYGNFLFAVARYTEKIYIVDITNPVSMQLVGSSGSIFNIPQGLLVDGSFAYVNNSANNSLDVINISNPASPSRVAQLTSIGELSHGVQKKSNIIYLSNYTNGFTVVDVSNPTSPSLVQQINSKESGDGTGAFNLYIIGNYLYVANDVNSSTPRIKIYDITNPSSPSYVNTLFPPNNVYSFNYDGYYLYCGLNKTSGSTNLAVYKMTSLTNPTLVATANSGRNAIIGSTVATIGGNGRFYAVGADFPGADIATYSVNNTSTVTSFTPNTRCGNGSVNLLATANAGTVTWYSDSTATTVVGTGTSFNSPSLAATTSYYVNSVNNNCSLPTIPVLATVNPTPVISSTIGASRRDTGTVDLQATTNIGLLNWYNVATGGTALGYGTTFTTPVVNNTTTFYVESQGTLCTSTRVPVVATVVTTPIIRTVNNGSHCLAGRDTLSATASIGTINWYDSYSSVTPLASGGTFITPSLSSSRFYMVSTTNNGETSPRVSVAAYIGNTPPIANAGADINNLCGSTTTMHADSINGGSGLWTILSGVATIANAGNINTQVSDINGNVQLLWTVSSANCPNNIDTLNIIAPKPKPIFYTAAYSCLNNSYRLVNYNANTDSIYTMREFWGSPDVGNMYAPLKVAKNNKIYGTSEGGGAAGQGTLFEFDPSTSIQKILYNFSSSIGNGWYPQEAFLMEPSAGVLFGIANNGGANNMGVLYKFNYQTGQYSVIRHLSTSEGYSIPCAVLKGSKIYLLARNGGTNNGGAIFELDTATNALVVKYNFTSGYASNCNSFVLGGDGNLYGIIPNGTSDFGEIFQYNLTTNIFSIKYSFPTNGTLGRYPSNLFAASNNKLYTTTGTNGANGNGTIIEYDPLTNTATKKFDFSSSANTSGGGNFMQASDGYLYAVSTSGGTYGNGALYRLNPSNGAFQIVRQLKCASTSGSLTGLPLAEYPTSNAYAGPDTTICGNTTTLTATSATYGTGTWTVTTGSATFANANSANTVVTLNSDTTILRWTITDNLCFTSFDEVQITRKALPVISSAVLLNCGAVNGSYTFSAVANGSVIKWYADTTGTIALGTGNTFSIAANNASAMIYVSATANGCTSNRMPVVISVPSIASAVSGVRCNAGSVQLQATANNGIINWYSTATGGTAIATGNNFSTPSITGTTVYYAEASQNGCVSARVADTAKINASITLANAGPDQSACTNTFTLAGNTPTQGTGIWTVVSGTATIANPTSPTTTITGVSGTATLRWSFNSSSCGISSDDVSLTSSITPLLWGVTGSRIFNFNTATSTIASQNNNAGVPSYNGNLTLFKASNGKLYGVSSNGGMNDYGLLYEYVPSTGTVNSIHSFTFNHTPRYGLVELNGVLYGIKNYCLYAFNLNTNTYSQTANFPQGSGTSYGLTVVGNILYGITDTYIYTYDPSTGAFTVKYTFGNSDGGSALVLGTNGKLYGTRSNSGSSSRGMIYEYDYINNIYTLKFSFSGGSGEYPGSSKLCAANNSKLYGTCNQNGGTNGTFWEYDYINNSYSIKSYFNNNSTSGANPGGNGIIQASDGNIYGVTYQGGSIGSGVLYKYNPNTNVFTTLQSIPWSSENPTTCTLVEYNMVTANAGPDQTVFSTTATMAANTPYAGIGTWVMMAGSATITSPNSPTTTVTSLKGVAILRWTVSTGACSNSYDDVVINSLTGIDSVTNGSRCGVGAGSVTLGAIAKQGTINWYAASTGGSSLGTGASFTTPSISSTTIYYVDVTVNGFVSSPRLPVTANVAAALATPTITTSGSTSLCVGSSVSLIAPTPSPISSQNPALKLWIDASKYNVSNGNSLNGVLRDESSYARSLSTDATYETNSINGHPSIRYNNNQTGTVSAFNTNQNTYVFTTVQFVAAASNWGTLFYHWNRDNGLTIEQNGTAANNIYHWQTGNDNSYCNQTISFGTTYIMAAKITSGNSRIFTLYGDSSGYLKNLGTVTNSSYTVPVQSGNLYIGKSDAGEYSNMRLGEFLYFQDSLPLSESSVVNYLYNKWFVGNGNFNGTYSYLWSPNGEKASSISVSTAGNYNVTLTDGNGCTATSAATTVSFTAGGVVANAGPDQNICTSTATLAANTPAAGTGTWTVVSGTATITNPNSPTTNVTGLKGTVTLRWTVVNGSCASAFDDIIINSSPAIASVTNGFRCGIGSDTLKATALQGSINWYAAATGGTSLGTGSSFITPSISSNTTYYVDVTVNGCTSTARTAVIANVDVVTTPVISASGSTNICTGSTASLSTPKIFLGDVMQFSGSNYVRDASPYYTFSNAITIEGWVNAGTGRIDMGQSTAQADNMSTNVWLWDGFYNNMWAFINYGGSWKSVNYTFPSTGWHHIATVASSAGVFVYVDGVQVGTTTGSSGTIQNNTASVLDIGKDSRGNGYGTFQTNEIRIWNAARTQAQISANMNNTISSSTSGLVGYYQFNQGMGIPAPNLVTGLNSVNFVNNPTVIFNQANLSNISYLWSPNGEKTNSIIASAVGNYSVTATDLNGCSATSAITTVTLNSTGVVANAGPDQVNCSGSFTMAGNATGTWTVVSGSATITTASSATTAVTVSSGSATLRWTINTSSCATTFDDVILTKTTSPLILLYTSNNEPDYPNYSTLNLFDNNTNGVVGKMPSNNTTFSGINYLYRASDGLLYGIADQRNLIVYNNTTKKFDVIYTFSGYFIPNIAEYNGELVIVLNNTMIAKYNLKSKSVYSITGQPNIPWSQNPSGGLVTVANKMYGMTSGGIYQYDPSNNTYTWKFDFNSNSGNTGNGEFVIASNGKLYATTNSGSNNNYGAFFEYDPTNNSIVQKAAFSTGSNGYNVTSTPILASNNCLYGTTRQGGANGYGTLWEYSLTSNTFSIKYNFTTTVGTATNKLMQGSDGYLYFITYASDTYGYGKVVKFDLTSNTLTVLKDYLSSASTRPNLSGPMLEEKFLANAGPDVYTVGSTGSLSPVNLLGNVANTKWSLVSGNATITNPDSANTTVTGISGITTLRLTTNYGACSSSTDDIVYYAQPTTPTVSNAARCGTGAGAGTVTLGALSNSGSGVVNWYAAATGGTSLGTGTSFITPSISSNTTYYADVTDRYGSKNVTYTVSNIYDQCNFNNSALNDNNFTTGVVANGNPTWIKASFDSAFTVNSIYLAAGLLCSGYSIAGFDNYYGAPAIYYSNDNTNWTYVRGTSGMTDNNGKQEFYIGGITAKYWKLQNPNNLSWGVAVSEFSFDFATNFSATSARVPVTASIGTTPSITNSTVSIGCTKDTLKATPGAGSINWYAAASGDTAISKGNSFITPTLNANTTYYVSAINSGCESSRQPVVANFNVPSIIPPTNVTVNNTYNQCGANVTVPAPTFNNACGGAAPTLTNNFNGTANASGNYPIGTTSVVWTATSASGNTATCTQTVTVTDAQSPNVLTQNRTIYLDNSGSATITAGQLNNGSTDNCGINTIEASKTSFDCTNIGANQVILSVTDVNGNTAANAATVTVLDTIKPVVIAPANIAVNSASGQCGANVSFIASASDNCSIASLTYSTASGSLFPVGTTVDTVKATDPSGNTRTATFTVTVLDNQAPLISCPANITVSCTASTDTSITGAARATDNCQVQNISWSDNSTKSANNTLCAYYTYTITRTWTASDIHGNSSSATQIITVKDTTKPVITASGSDLNIGCNPTQAAIEAALGTASATDDCSILGTPTATDGDLLVIGNLYLKSRSFNITDVCGNAATTVTRTAIWSVIGLPSVGIVADTNNVCTGATITFTATPSSGASNTSYQWVKNGVSISGATSNTYSYSPANGDTITCNLTASNACQTAITVTSNPIIATVNAFVTPSVIAAITSGSQTSCLGGSVTFTATPTFGGSNPSYNFRVNGISVQSGSSATYTQSSVANGDVVTCVLTANNACQTTNTATSNVIAETLNYIWTGAASTEWSNANNWCGNNLPDTNYNVLIPGGLSNYPIISNTVSIKNITINSGASVMVIDTLKMAGAITNNGILKATNGSFVLNGASAQSISANTFTNDTIKNLLINNAAGVTLGAPIYITGTVTPTTGTLHTGGYLTLVSTATKTARIDQIIGGVIDGYVTVQRYIPAKTVRRYSFVASPVTQTIRNAWQKQVYITGAGTGGAVCGATAGDGGITDRYNSNGFDFAQNNSPSMFIYNAVPVNRNRYLSIASTNNTSLTPGIGYEINVRGNRNSINATCNDQLASTSPTPPAEVTLSATGTVTTGNLAVPLNDPAVSEFTLLGNPYPSQISLSAVANDASNSSLLYNKMWTYSPFITSGNFTTYSQGVIVNAISGFDNTNGDYIASGQAFFVHAKANGSITFKESHKTKGTVPNAQYFGTANSKLIRLGIYSSVGSKQDETAIRFNTNGTKSYNPEWDARSLSAGSQTLASVKEGIAYAIATRPDVNVDTVNLQIKSKVTGTFTLKTTDIAGFDKGNSRVILKDNFLGVTHDLLKVPDYQFNITSDSLSKGMNRFQLLIHGNTTLPISFIQVNGEINNGTATIKWSIANAGDSKNFIVEKSTDGISFSSISTVSATKATNYAAIDANVAAGTSYYRIKVMNGAGAISYSNVVKLSRFDTQHSTYSLYPNPLKGSKVVNVSLNNVVAGKYTVTLTNVLGQKVQEVTISHTGVNSIKTISINKTLATGVYSVTIRETSSGAVVSQSNLSVN